MNTQPFTPMCLLSDSDKQALLNLYISQSRFDEAHSVANALPALKAISAFRQIREAKRMVEQREVA